MEPDLIDAGIYRAVPQGRDEGSWGSWGHSVCLLDVAEVSPGRCTVRNWNTWDMPWPPPPGANKQAEDRRQKGEA